MSAHTASPLPPLYSSGSARSFLLVCQSMAHAMAYRRLGGAKAAGSLKAVEQSRAGAAAVLTYGTVSVLREMDVRHPAALLVQELIEGHHSAFGMGCTTLVAWIGLFASAFAELIEAQSLRPATIAATLADIREQLASALDWSSAVAAASSTDATVLPLTQLIDQHRAAQPAAPAPAAAPISQPSEDEDDVDWFFDSAAAPSAASAASADPPLPPADPLLAFLSALGSSLAHGQDASMAAAVAVMQRLLRGEGISDLAALREAMEKEQDITEAWDLSGMIQTQTRIGPAASSSSLSSLSPSLSAAPPTRSSTSSDHLPPQSWELVEGVLLDLFDPEVGPVRSALKRLQAALPSPSSPAASAALPVGLVLVLGDVALPEDHAAVTVPRSSSNAAGAASATEIIQGVLQRHEQRSEAFLARLLKRLQSLGVSLVLAKGSFNKLVQSHLRAHGIICLETVNYPVLEGASRVAQAPLVCELAEIAAAHVGRATIELKSVGWNPSLAHKNVTREMDKDSAPVEAPSDWKIVLGPAATTSALDAAPLPPLTLFSSHSTSIHARIFSVSFWNCLNRLRAALKDRCVLRGAGYTERRWANMMEQRSREIEGAIAHKLTQLPSATQLDDSLVHSLALHRAVAVVFRNYLHLLARNSGESSEEQSWIASASETELAAPDSPPCYDTRSSTLSALSTCFYLFSVFPHLDATLLCAHGRVVYQQLDGHRDPSGRNVRIM